MNEDVRQLQRQIRDMQSHIVRVDSRARQAWAYPAFTPTSPIAPLYFVVGGNVLASGQTIGVAKRSDAVAGSELPAGVGGSSGDIITMPAFPIPAGLPSGVGVGQHITNLNYVFLLLDNRTFYSGDIPLMHRAYTGSIVNLDRVVAGVTYRYPCQLIVAGF